MHVSQTVKYWLAPTAFSIALTFPGRLSALDYEKDVMPIFEAKCYKCHSAEAEKVKGGLRLDDPEHFQKRFAKNDVVIPGNWDASYLFVTVSRPHDDEDAMPPTDKGTPLTQEEVLLVANWIYEGAAINGARGEKGPKEELPEKYIRPGKDILEQLSSKESEELQTWTNREGKKVIAKLLRVEGENAILELEDGRAYRYPLVKFSEESRTQAIRVSNPQSDIAEPGTEN